MPSQQGLWLDKEASSAGSREKPAQSGKNRSIRGPQGRTRQLSGAGRQLRGGALRPRWPGPLAHYVRDGATGGDGRRQCRGRRAPRSIFVIMASPTKVQVDGSG